MGAQYEYRIEVGGGEVTGRFCTADQDQAQDRTYGPEELEPTRLQLDTITVLQKWLNRWTAVRTHNLPVPGTFEVLGQHLHEIVLPGRVGAGLLEARRTAVAQRATLRLRLEFGPDAEDLAQLPWELLHTTEDSGAGEFLGQAHRVVLSRLLRMEWPVTAPKDPPLRVCLVIAVPDTPGYAEQRRQLSAALEQAAEYSSSIQVEIQERWDHDRVRQRLSQAPYPHVVHFAGICKRVWDSGVPSLKVCLDDGHGAERWVSPTLLVNLFRDNQYLDPENQVRLVVLHLCEPSPLDYEVTFERLAPELIRVAVPAVLAMQYPLTGEPASSFIQYLYEELADRKSIEEAVQKARSMLYEEYEEDLLFGAPVLYVQSRDSQLLPDAAALPATAEAGPASGAPVPRAVRTTSEVLGALVLGQAHRSQAARDEAYASVTAPDWPDDCRATLARLARLIRVNAHRPELAALFAEVAQAAAQACEEPGGG